MRTEYKDDPILSKITVIFSIHNLKYQGLFDPRFVAEMDFDAGQSKIPNFFDKAIIKLNGMRRGIKYADVVNTVSPTYAKEIITEDFGEKLDKLLSERKNCLFGILNGIDTTSWNPENDKIIEFNYSKNNFENRFKNKVVLQRRFGLPTDKNKFVVGMVSRLSSQKGFDLIEKSLESLMDNLDFQFIIVGEGDSRYRKFFEDLKKKYPHRIGGHYVFDSILPRLIFAGADAVLIPSKYEPSGLTQMEAMRYGCVPIVRKVGGLADTVDDFNPSANNTGTGFVFKKYDSFALSVAFVRAYEIHKQTKEWRKIAIKGMKKDFSWKKSAREYIKIFSLAMHLHQKAKKHSS
jgi:starch synthase